MTKKITLSLLFIAGLIRAQDSHFSQFWANPLHLNPALTGNSSGDMRFVSNYRTQWKAVAEPYNTLGASADFTLPSSKGKDFWAMGANFLSDKGGLASYKTTTANYLLSYNKPLSGAKTNLISIGMSAGYAQRAWDSPSLSWDSQWNGIAYDPNLPTNESPQTLQSLNYLDVAVGVVSNYQITKSIRTMAGVSLAHFNRSDLSFTKAVEDIQKVKTTAHFSMQIANQGKSGLSYIPSMMFVQQGPQRMLNFGTSVRYRLQDRSRYTGFESEVALLMGLYYRWRDAAYAAMKVEYGDFSLGISYDVNISKLSLASNGRGGFETSLIYSKNLFGKSKNNPKAGIKYIQF